jgi:hypothetical protein
MASLEEIRKQLVELRDFLIRQKGGLTTQKTEKHKGMYDYAIKRSDTVRKEVNKTISMLDEYLG